MKAYFFRSDGASERIGIAAGKKKGSSTRIGKYMYIEEWRKGFMGKARAGNKPSGGKKACAAKALTRIDSIDMESSTRIGKQGSAVRAS